MTEILSFEEWKKKQIYDDDEMKADLKTFLNIDDKTTQREIEGLLQEGYKWYTRAIESRDELKQGILH